MIEEKYQELLEKRSDVNKHFPTIRKYVAEGDTVLELGVRHMVSTWALLANKPSQLISVDVVAPPEDALREVKEATQKEGINFQFQQQDSTVVDLFPGVDVLFVDTLHLYSQVVKELWRHAHKTRKYIIFHDYHIPEVSAAIHDFLYNTDWEWAEINAEDSGLAVVKRVR